MAHDLTPGSLPVGDTGENLDTTIVETTEGNVHREVIVVADPADPDARGKVGKNALSGDYAVVVRDPRMDDVVACLNGLTEELKMIRFHLNLITEFES